MVPVAAGASAEGGGGRGLTVWLGWRLLMPYPSCESHCQTTVTKVFTNKRRQTIRLQAELRLPDTVKQVDVRTHGCELIIVPLGHTWGSFFLDSQPVADDFLSVRVSQ